MDRPMFKHGPLFRRVGSCLVWRGSINAAGYGYVRMGRRIVLMHRLAYEIAYGPVPNGMEVCHRWEAPQCSRACSEPTHLFAGTHSDNMRDMQLKGRARGALASATFTTSEHFEVARSAVVEPQWMEQAVAPSIHDVDPDRLDTIVGRYFALGERRPAAIARTLQIPIADVRRSVARLSTVEG